MKICFITNNIFKLGGVERVLSVLASELCKEHEITILCTQGKNPIDRSIYNLDERVNVEINTNLMERPFILKAANKIGKEINKFTGILNKEKHLNKISKLYFPHKTRENFINYINSNKFDIVIGVQGRFSLLLGIIKDKVNSKVMGWQHNSYEAYLKNPNRYHWNQDVMFNKYISNLDEYIVLTDYDKNMFKSERDIDCTVIHNPKSFVSDIKSPLTSKKFLAAGRFNVQKGFDLLIESYKLFCEKNKEWNLVIVGEGEEKSKIEKLIKKYNLENRVEIHGFTNKINEYFLESSVLLLPSRWEGMPMIVLESLEMGVPIVSYDITAATQIITDNREGIIVPKYNVEEFAKAMEKISESDILRNKMARNCILKSLEFDIQNIAKKWNEVFSLGGS